VREQVEGFERSQLSSLFCGIMSHLLADVSDAIHQQQQQAAGAEGRRRRQAVKGRPESAAVADAGAAVSVQGCRQQVAAALAAHVSARVPFNSSLAPHVLQVLQDEVSLVVAALELRVKRKI
jgi:hypothetical protein